MLEKLSFTQKKFGLLALALLLTWASWQLAFKNTLSSYLQYRELAGQTNMGQDLSFPSGYNMRKQVNLDKILQGYRQDSTAFRDNLLYQVAFQAARQEVKVVQVPASEGLGDKMILQRVTFQGSYFALVRLISEFKKTKGMGRIRSVKIRQASQTEKLRQTIMEVYFVYVKKFKQE
jgi:hypothetical protein